MLTKYALVAVIVLCLTVLDLRFWSETRCVSLP